MDFQPVFYLALLVLALILVAVELFRSQQDLYFEVIWLRRTVAVIGLGLMFSVLKTAADDERNHVLIDRLASYEEAIHQLSAKLESQQAKP